MANNLYDACMEYVRLQNLPPLSDEEIAAKAAEVFKDFDSDAAIRSVMDAVRDAINTYEGRN